MVGTIPYQGVDLPFLGLKIKKSMGVIYLPCNQAQG